MQNQRGNHHPATDSVTLPHTKTGNAYTHQKGFRLGCSNRRQEAPCFIDGTFKVMYSCDEAEIDRVLDVYFTRIRGVVKQLVRPTLQRQEDASAPRTDACL